MQPHPNPASAPIKVRAIATGLTALQAFRLCHLTAAHADAVDPAIASLADSFESLTGVEIQQRLAAQGVQVTLDFATQLQLDAVVEAENRVVAAVDTDGEQAAASIDHDDGSGLHGTPLFVVGVDIVDEGGAA